jgi:HTH-type transcriptional regulator / antitoxin HigA
MNIRPIKTEDDLTWALKEVEKYFDNEPEKGSPEGDRFEILVTLIQAYEAVHYPIPEATPVEALQFSMEQNGRTQTDLANLLGSRSRASEILSGKRELTKEQAWKIHEAWHIPVALLLRPAPTQSPMIAIESAAEIEIERGSKSHAVRPGDVLHVTGD